MSDRGKRKVLPAWPIRMGTAIALIALLPPASARAQADPPAAAKGGAAADDRTEDRAAVRAAMAAFVKAFESRDAKAMAAIWTAGGEFTNVDGVTVRGRETLEKAFEKVLAGSPEIRAQVELHSLKFLAKDAAIEEGKVVVQRGQAARSSRAHYSALWIREAGRWLLAELAETADEAASVEDLAWLIGEWKSSSGEGAEIRTTYAWAPGKRFIHSRFAIREKEIELRGTQVIGVDPATGLLHSWTFEADGSIGEADWSADGDHWVLGASGTLVDGRTLVETNILRRLNDDTFTWQSVSRLLDDDVLPDLAPVKVTRVKPAK